VLPGALAKDFGGFVVLNGGGPPSAPAVFAGPGEYGDVALLPRIRARIDPVMYPNPDFQLLELMCPRIDVTVAGFLYPLYVFFAKLYIPLAILPSIEDGIFMKKKNL
jgi:hypothetical protein